MPSRRLRDLWVDLPPRAVGLGYALGALLGAGVVGWLVASA